MAKNDVKLETGSIHLFHSKAGNIQESPLEAGFGHVFDLIHVLPTQHPVYLIQSNKNYLVYAYI